MSGCPSGASFSHRSRASKRSFEAPLHNHASPESYTRSFASRGGTRNSPWFCLKFGDPRKTKYFNCPAAAEEHGSRECPSKIVFVANRESGGLVKERCIRHARLHADINRYIILRTIHPCVLRVVGDYSMCLSCVYTCGAVAASLS